MTAITSLDNGTASLTDLLGRARPPLAGTIDQLNRLAPLLDDDKDRLDATFQRLPEIYRKLARVGSYGAFFPYYICGITFRASDLQGRTVVFPWIKQETGRCAERLDAEIPRIQTHQGRLHRRRPDHPRHRGRAAAGTADLHWATALRYQALFSEAGGLAVGNDVTVSGIKVGSVSSIELDNGDALVGFTIDGKYALGSDTTAHIRTGTLLGERVLALESGGQRHARPPCRSFPRRGRRRRTR